MPVEVQSNSDVKLDALLERALRHWEAREERHEPELYTTDYLLDERKKGKFLQLSSGASFVINKRLIFNIVANGKNGKV